MRAAVATQAGWSSGSSVHALAQSTGTVRVTGSAIDRGRFLRVRESLDARVAAGTGETAVNAILQRRLFRMARYTIDARGPESGARNEHEQGCDTGFHCPPEAAPTLWPRPERTLGSFSSTARRS